MAGSGSMTAKSVESEREKVEEIPFPSQGKKSNTFPSLYREIIEEFPYFH